MVGDKLSSIGVTDVIVKEIYDPEMEKGLIKNRFCGSYKYGVSFIPDPARNSPGGDLLSHFSEKCIDIVKMT